MGVSDIITEISQYQQVIYLLYMLINIVCESRSMEVGALFDVFAVLCLEKWKLVGVAY